MPLFRKKPVVVEAWQWTPPQLTDMPDWLSEAIDNGYALAHRGPPAVVTIQTLEGTMNAAPGDWIIKGVKGELYPCKPDIFAATYELAAAEHLPDAEEPAGPELIIIAEQDPVGAEPALSEDDFNHPNQRATRFRDALEEVINRHSRENGSDTPDFILGQFVLDVMDAFDRSVRRRDEWLGWDIKRRSLEHVVSHLQAQLESEGEHTAAGQAEIERLHADVASLHSQLTRAHTIIEQSEAENEKLRGELQRVSMAGLEPSMVGG